MRHLFKILIISIVIVMLSGCQDSALTLKQSFSTAIENASNSEITKISNHNATYFDYYLPITMGRLTSTDTSVILKSFNTEILMTIDIVNVVLNGSLSNQNSLRAVFNSDKALSSIEGKTLDARGYDQTYRAQVFDLQNEDYLIVVQTPNTVISAKAKLGLVSDLSYEMLRLARTVVIDRSLILANYSNTETINYQKVNLNMFSQMAPESGTVLDMIEGEESNLLDDDYYEQINDSPTEEEILQD